MKDVTDQWQSVDSEGRQIYRVFLRDGEFDFPLLVVYLPGLTYTAEPSGGTRGGRLLPVEKPKAWRPFRDFAEAFKVMGPNAYWRPVSETVWIQFRYWDFKKRTIDGQSLCEMFDHCEWTLDPSQTTGNRCGVEE